MMDLQDPQAKKALLLGALLLLGGGYFGYEHLYRPKAEAVAEMEARLENLRIQNSAARVMVGGNGQAEVEERLNQFRGQLTRVEGLIPSSEELPDLLDAISAEAQRTGVELTLIQPAGAVAEEFYTRRTYELAVVGGYHPIGEFLTRIASLPRIVTPANLHVIARGGDTPGRDPQLEAKFTIETYVLPSGETNDGE